MIHPSDVIRWMRETLQDVDISTSDIKYEKFSDSYVISIFGSELTFDLLKQVSDALNTKNINVVSEYYCGFYGVGSSNLTLEIKFPKEKGHGG